MAEALVVALASRVEQNELRSSELVDHHNGDGEPGFNRRPSRCALQPAGFRMPSSPESVSPQSIKSGKFETVNRQFSCHKLNPRFPRVWDIPVVRRDARVGVHGVLVLESDTPRRPCCGRCSRSPSSLLQWSPRSLAPREAISASVLQTCWQRMSADTLTISGEVRGCGTSLGRVHRASRAESARLANMRDTLLPALMSGQVRVKDAERVVGEVSDGRQRWIQRGGVGAVCARGLAEHGLAAVPGAAIAPGTGERTSWDDLVIPSRLLRPCDG